MPIITLAKSTFLESVCKQKIKLHIYWDLGAWGNGGFNSLPSHFFVFKIYFIAVEAKVKTTNIYLSQRREGAERFKVS